MRPTVLFALILFVVGISLTIVGLMTADSTVYLVLFIPVIQSNSALAILGILLLFLGLVLLFANLASAGVVVDRSEDLSRPTVEERDRRFGGVVLVGPLPIVFGSSQRIAKYMMILGLILTVLLILVLLILAR